jgi:hypothetical protein
LRIVEFAVAGSAEAESRKNRERPATYSAADRSLKFGFGSTSFQWN